MAWQLWQDAPGRLPNRLHTCSPIWSGGVRTTILCVPMQHCVCPWYIRTLEGATVWPNATGNGLLPWWRGEPLDDGRHGKCCATPYRRCLASERAHEGCEQTRGERAGGRPGKGKTGIGAWIDSRKYPFFRVT